MTVDQAVQFFASHGISRSDLGSLERLKKAHRKLALKLHPDRNPGDPNATKLMSQLNGAYQALVEAAGRIGQQRDPSFDYESWVRDAMDATKRNMEEAERAAAGWTPPDDVVGVTEAELAAWAQAVVDRGFFKRQLREYTPHRPFGFDAGYSGRVVQTRTDRKMTPHGLVEGVLGQIRKTAPTWERAASGDSRQLGMFGVTDKLVPARKLTDLVVKLTLENDYAAIRWAAAQSWDAFMFGYQTRWHSISFEAPKKSKKAIPKAQQLNRGKVETKLRAAGMTLLNPRAWKQSRWAFEGARREIVTKDRAMRAGGGYDVHYYGQITPEALDGFIAWARGGQANCGCAVVDDLKQVYGQGNRAGQAAFVHPSDIPIAKAKAVAVIVSTAGSGTHEAWALMDAWVAAQGLREVLRQIGRIHEANGHVWNTAEERWWISQLT